VTATAYEALREGVSDSLIARPVLTLECAYSPASPGKLRPGDRVHLLTTVSTVSKWAWLLYEGRPAAGPVFLAEGR
jgi:hypothetical protein